MLVIVYHSNFAHLLNRIVDLQRLMLWEEELLQVIVNNAMLGI